MLIRALIVLLLVLNLGVAAWWLWSAPTSPESTVELPPHVARLQLVREREARATATTTSRPAGTEAAPGVPLTAEAASEGEAQESAAGAAMVTGTAGDPATAPATAPAAPVTSNADATAAAAASSSDTARCYSFGPFDSEDTLVAAQATLKPLTEALVVRRIPLRSGRGWRVYLPPLANPEEATAAAGRISAAGFRDYFIVREGAEANSVALGRFGSEAAARRHADALNAAGFTAVRAEPLGGGTGAAWVDVRAAMGFDAAAARAQAGASQLRPADCTSVR